MRRLIIALLATGAAVAALLFVYGEQSPERKCASVAADVADAARETGGRSPAIENLTVGDGRFWCSFEVATGVAFDRGDQVRVAVVQESERALIDSSYCGIRVELVYEDGPDILSTLPCPRDADPTTPSRRR